MPRVSKYLLDKNVEKEAFQLFWHSIAKLHGAAEVSVFFSDLLSDTEEMMLAKRFAVALLLERGKRPVEIVQTLHVSYALVGSVSSWVKNAKPRTKRVIAEIAADQEWHGMFDRVDALLDSLPMSHGMNWKEEGKERSMRLRKRLARSVLQ